MTAEELQLLLENFWILRDNNKEYYHRIRDAQEHIRPFLEKKLGYRLIVNPQMAKIEKVPGKTEAWMGIEDFRLPMDYSLLCLCLAFLEDKSPEEQFVLTNITEYVQAAYPGEEKVDWTLFSHRKSLVRTLGFMTNLGMIRVNDGQQERFSQEQETDFPDNKNISDIILQLGGVLREKIEAGKITVQLDDTLALTETDFNTILLEVRKRFKAGWYKTYREMALDKLLREVMETMISWKMLAWDEDLRAVKILAMVGKFIGSYPRNFGKGEDTDER